VEENKKLVSSLRAVIKEELQPTHQRLDTLEIRQRQLEGYNAWG
jgi:hypothetical protein